MENFINALPFMLKIYIEKIIKFNKIIKTNCNLHPAFPLLSLGCRTPCSENESSH